MMNGIIRFFENLIPKKNGAAGPVIFPLPEEFINRQEVTCEAMKSLKDKLVEERDLHIMGKRKGGSNGDVKSHKARLETEI